MRSSKGQQFPARGCSQQGLVSQCLREAGRADLGLGDQIQSSLQSIREECGDGAGLRSSQEVSLPVRIRSSDGQAGLSWQRCPEVKLGSKSVAQHACS